MKASVDRGKCIGCGLCTSICGDVFELKNGKSFVKKNAKIKGNEAKIKEAAESCPVQAISAKI